MAMFHSLPSIHVKHQKNTAELESVIMPVPAEVTISMSQHIGAPCKPVVKVGDTVKVGQLIGDSEAAVSAPIHSSVSGKVKAIEQIFNARGAKSEAIVITTDGEQTIDETLTPPAIGAELEDVLVAVRACGLMGLGGAGFPTSVKLAGLKSAAIDTLVINGAECEPYLTCDYRIMLEKTDLLLEGAELILRHMPGGRAVIGIENNKPKAIEKIKADAAAKGSKLEVLELKSRYPQGAEKVIVYEATGRVIPEGKLPSDVGVLVMNVGTVIKLAEDVNLKKVALATAGCVGADLANLVNEAALRAVRKGRKLVTQEDLLAAFELVIAGTEKKGSVLTEFEKKLVAYHEVGHAMVAYKQKNTEPVQKITIVPHTQGALGYTLLMPEEDKTELRTRDELMAKITVSMGGRAAEEVVMNTMTNGASQDIQDATNVARNMVAMFGMSDEFGMMALASRRNQYLDGGYVMDCAQDTAARMDQAVKELLDKCYKAAVEVIRENREDMDKVVAYLLEKETITGAEMVAIIEGRDPSTVEDAYASTLAHESGFRPSQPEVIEPAARKVHMISEKIEAPEDTAGDAAPKPSSDEQTSGSAEQTPDAAPEQQPENPEKSE